MAIATADSSDTAPAKSALSVIMMVAELDWMTAVTSMPASRNAISG